MVIKSLVICKVSYFRGGKKSRPQKRKYLRYIAAEHPGLGYSGLFGPDDCPDPDLQDVARELRGHDDLPAWKIVVSMRESDAVRCGLTNRESWVEAIRRGVETAIRVMQLHREQARWAAAYHPTPGHPHCHVLIWEVPYTGARRQAQLYRGEIKRIWRGFTRELLRDERSRRSIWKLAVEDVVRELAGADLARAAEIRREMKELARQREGVLRSAAKTPEGPKPLIHLSD